MADSHSQPFVKFSPPVVGEEEIREVVETLQSDWLTTGPRTRQFEQEFAEFVAAPGALALSSCTAALHLALVNLGIGPGDEVITTPITFTSTANVVEHVGATLVLADVEPDTLNIDPARVEAAITPRTRCILPVHFAGHPVDLDAIHSLATAHRLHVVEDAAHAVHASYRGRPIGSGSNPTAFSFYATKNMTTAEGGMLTGDEQFLSRARVSSLHGMSREAWKRYEQGGTWRYDVVMPGFKCNMTDIQAALGRCQLRRLPQLQARRREVVAAYRNAFAASGFFECPAERDDIDHAWHLFVLRLRPEYLAIDRDQFIAELQQRQIGTSVHFIPLFCHSYYRNRYRFDAADYPVATANFPRYLSLPLSGGITDAEVGRVIEAVLDVAACHQRRRLRCLK